MQNMHYYLFPNFHVVVLWWGEVIGLIHCSNCVINKAVKSCAYCSQIHCPKTGALHYYAQLGVPDKGRVMKEFFGPNEWSPEV